MVLMSQTNQEKFLSERKAYYQNTFILMEIVKCLKNKELAWLEKSDNPKKNIRYLYASKMDFLKMHFEKLDFYDYNVNMYCSCANLSHIPVITYNLKTRRFSPEYQEINNNYSKYVIAYDMLYDFDGKENFELCYKEARDFKAILEEMKVPYILQNSSKRGFHFIIEGKWFDNSNPIKNIDIFRNVIYNIKGIYDFKSLDDSITDLKRIRKLSYSVVSDGSICLPLSDEQFESFISQLIDIKCVLKRVQIKNRGLLERNYGLSESELRQNVMRFIKEYR
jgi:hypothetical protein